MVNPRSRGDPVWRRWGRGVITLCGSFLLLPAAYAAPLAIVLSDDSAPYQEVYEAIKARADERAIGVARLFARTAAAMPRDARLVVTVGAHAAQAVAALPGRAPVLAVLVPRGWYQKTGRPLLVGSGMRPASAIYLDQPFERQAHLIRLAFPQVKRVGVLLSADRLAEQDGLGTALRRENLTLVSEVLNGSQKLIAPLEHLFAGADLLLALPDPIVFNRMTAPSVFLTSYRYRDPVLGYSNSLTRAGALLSLYSTPAQIGRQTAETAFRELAHARVQLAAPAYPRYYSVSVNRQVARSLGFDVPPENELEHALQAAEDD